MLFFRSRSHEMASDLFAHVATVVYSWIGHTHEVLQSLKVAEEAAVFRSEDLLAPRLIHCMQP